MKGDPHFEMADKLFTTTITINRWKIRLFIVDRPQIVTLKILILNPTSWRPSFKHIEHVKKQQKSSSKLPSCQNAIKE